MTRNKYCYEYPRPALTTDCVIFGFDGKEMNVLLIERGIEPYKGKWAFPGGFVNMDETTDEGAKRELEEETGIKDINIEQLHTFSEVKRDPRGRTISVVYYAMVRTENYRVLAGDDANKAHWFKLDEIPALAFDHDQVLIIAQKRLKEKIRLKPIGIDLLDKEFSLQELQLLYESILGEKIDSNGFQSAIMKNNLLVTFDNKNQEVKNNTPQLYKFNLDIYEKLTMADFSLEL